MTSTTAPAKLAGIVSIVFGVLLFVPVAVLGAAIGWPASLDEPAAVLMPLIVAQEDSVRLGYLVYLLYSVLFFPAIALIGRVVGDTPTTRLAIGFAAISAVARGIGILRWLTVLPAIAATYVAGTRENPQPGLEPIFDAINAYGGGIGELLGVSAFGALSIGFLSAAIVSSRVLPRWLGVFGFVAAACLMLPWLEVFGLDLGAILSVSVSVVQLWFLVAGAVLLRSRRSDAEPARSASGSHTSSSSSSQTQTTGDLQNARGTQRTQGKAS